jgi:hypothetical protein
MTGPVVNVPAEPLFSKIVVMKLAGRVFKHTKNRISDQCPVGSHEFF